MLWVLVILELQDSFRVGCATQGSGFVYSGFATQGLPPRGLPLRFSPRLERRGAPAQVDRASGHLLEPLHPELRVDCSRLEAYHLLTRGHADGDLFS